MTTPTEQTTQITIITPATLWGMRSKDKIITTSKPKEFCYSMKQLWQDVPKTDTVKRAHEEETRSINDPTLRSIENDDAPLPPAELALQMLDLKQFAHDIAAKSMVSSTVFVIENILIIPCPMTGDSYYTFSLTAVGVKAKEA